jgi:hypothetical protein
MTHLNVTTNQVEVVISEDSGSTTTIFTASAPSVVTAVAEGPQGPPGPIVPIGALTNVDTSGATDGSVIYYDSSTSFFKASSTWTTSSLADGGNF